MRLNAPKFITWFFACLLAVLGVILYLAAVAGASSPAWMLPLAFWIEALSVVILAVATATARL